jgi:UDPglucose 6-dehydrogenase
VAFATLARQHGVEAILTEATDRLNRQQVPRLAGLLLSHLPEGGSIGILGLSYKPETKVVEESQGLALARQLLASGAPVVVYDPAAMDEARKFLNGSVTFAHSAKDCAQQAHVLAITTAWDEFKNISPEDLNASLGRPTVVDCWRILKDVDFGATVRYLTLGTGLRKAEGEPPTADEAPETMGLAVDYAAAGKQ